MLARPALTALLIAGVTLGPAAARAPAADDLVYRCGPNLCKVRTDGSGRQQLTRDGRPGGPVYSWLSASLDGSHLGVSFGNDAYVLDRRGHRLGERLRDAGGAVTVVQIAPDGRSVATIEQVLELRPPITTPVPYLFLDAADGGSRDTVARSVTTTGWLGERLMRSEPSRLAPFEQQICLLASNTDFACERLVASDPGYDLWTPAASPDGRFVAAVRAPLDRTEGPIAIYDSTTGQRLRVLTDGAADATPAWSRDGRRIAFARGDSIYVVPASGGRPRSVARGTQAVWVPGQVLRLRAPARGRADARVRVTVRAPGAPRGSRVSLQRRTGRRYVTLAKAPVVRGRVRFTVRLGRGRQRLRALLKAPRTPPLASKAVAVRVR